MIVYHIISITVLHNWGYENINTLALARDIGRLAIVGTAAMYHYKQIIPFLQKRKQPLLRATATIVTSLIVSYQQGSSPYDMIIGIKYGFMFLRIVLSAVFIGYNLSEKHIQAIQYRLPRTIATIIVLGLLWQMAKYLWPDMFFQLGYGPIGDFIFGQEPPIYYRTGPGGEPRLQGLFAGPNNYGYFLAAFFPLLLSHYTNKKSKNQKLIRHVVITITILSIILTLSRTAIIGAILGAILLYRNTIKQHKKLLVSIIVATVIIIGGLSIFKGGSTREHIIQKTNSIKYIIQQPQGYGLGTAGPAVHHNGSILPENYYMQIAIDIGTIGFILLMMTVLSIIQQYRKEERGKPYMIGFFVLLVMGLLLHVFEDSMVNYLFFIPRGLYLGYSSNLEKKQYQTGE